MTTDNRQLVTAPLQNQTIYRTVLDNGMVVLVAENPAADIIAARIFVKAGSGLIRISKTAGLHCTRIAGRQDGRTRSTCYRRATLRHHR